MEKKDEYLMMGRQKDNIKEEMKWLSEQEGAVFIGEGIVGSGRIYGTLDDVPTNKCVEMPIAENLVVGVAIGLAMKGYKPIVVFQRMDFMLCGADALINHLALIPHLSNGQFRLPVMVRTIVGSQNPKFDVGVQHNKDLRHVFEPWIKTFKYEKGIYRELWEMDEPKIVVEWKDAYD